MLAAEFGVGQVVWSIVWFFLFLMWIMLFFQVATDVFRSSDLSGVAKALWIIAVILFPYLGVFVYLIVRGGKMHQRQAGEAAAAQSAIDDYIRQTAGTTASPAAELARLAELRDQGVIDETEFAALKAKVLSA